MFLFVTNIQFSPGHPPQSPPRRRPVCLLLVLLTPRPSLMTRMYSTTAYTETILEVSEDRVCLKAQQEIVMRFCQLSCSH